MTLEEIMVKHNMFGPIREPAPYYYDRVKLVAKEFAEQELETYGLQVENYLKKKNTEWMENYVKNLDEIKDLVNQLSEKYDKALDEKYEAEKQVIIYKGFMTTVMKDYLKDPDFIRRAPTGMVDIIKNL